MKKKRHRSIANQLLLLIGLVMFCFAAIELFGIFWQYHIGVNEYDSIRKEAVHIAAQSDTQAASTEQPDNQKDAPAWATSIQVDFDALKKINPQTIGWLYFDNNDINYPIMQADNNNTYLHILPDGTKNSSGSIFMEAKNKADFEDTHTIVYGHNMKNLSMFGKLKYYKMKKDFYQENPEFTIFTPTAAYRYQIFSYYDVSAKDSVYRIGFQPDETFQKFVEKMLQRSYIDTGVTAGKDDKIVTLSTCSTTGKRFLVHAKRIDAYVY